MTDAKRGDESATSSNGGGADGTSRRSVLRRSATTLAVGLAGLAVAPTSVDATTCPRIAAAWRARPDEWPSFSEETTLLLLDGSGDELRLHPNDRKGQILAEMSTPAGGDAYLRLVAQYVAARLNKQIVRPHPDEYTDFWDRIAEYNRWVRGAGRPQHEWTVDGVDGWDLLGYFVRWNHGVGWSCQWNHLSSPNFGLRPY